MQARGELLIKYEIPAVTRDYTSRTVGLHPLACLPEEANVAVSRKRGIHLVVSTQAPT